MGLRDFLSPASPRYTPLGFPRDSASKLPPRRVLWVFALTVCAFVLLIGAFGPHGPPPPPGGHHDPHSYGAEDQMLDGKWRFDHRRDALNYGLSDAQCNAAFPDLYEELDRARHWYSDEGIQEEDVHIWTKDENTTDHHHGQFHVLIHHGELIIIDERAGTADRSRGLSALASMYRAINSIPNPRDIPDIEFVFDIQDISGDRDPEDRVRWAWCRYKDDQDVWVMPDFDGWSYPDDAVGSYVAFRENVAALEQPFEEKIPELVWRGSTGVAHDLRMNLVNSAEGKDWSDVKQINWMTRENVMRMEEFCNYQYVAHTEGNSWSGRLRYLQNCLSVSVIHDLDYVAHYYPLLKSWGPEQNYVRVNRQFSDLDAQMQDLLAHPSQAKQIAEESARTFRDRYLTPAAEACYWRRMFASYAAVQNFSPRLYDEEVIDGEVVRRQRRGMSFERFAFRQKGSNEHGFIVEDDDSWKPATPVANTPADTPTARAA